ncbi:MAG: hypothetical protein CO129_05095 [Ignavibacteriales bacterium CG_4_9_14_3_um_filter_34_10]|nr:MAG: hypothetical protein CO129_05095 [Ignavibacteriales bacterium CG_4_9_14_3_um_filter_34_10]
MTHREQTKYIDALRKYEKKMEPKEAEIFKMFLKRHHDDEDFDKLSAQKLIELYDKYYVHREKKNLDIFFKNPENNSDSGNTEE